MAFPVILVDSATGSDTLASGAGPATALNGSAGLSSADGLTITLDGSPDLSGVATDGSHTLTWYDATAGNRNHAAITSKGNSGTPTAFVGLAQAVGISLTKAWSIGGVRASIGGTTSKKLFDNNAAAGDAMPGWTEQIKGTHAETLAATFQFRRSGDATDGYITLQGEPGAALPVLTFTNNSSCLNSAGATFGSIKNVRLKNTNATKTASNAVALTSGADDWYLENIVADDATDKFWKGIVVNNADRVRVRHCRIGNTANLGYVSENTSTGCSFFACESHDCGSHGFVETSPSSNYNVLHYCHAWGNAGSGFVIDGTSATGNQPPAKMLGCTSHDNGNDALRILQGTGTLGGFRNLELIDCNFTGNAGFGVNFSSGTPPTTAELVAHGFRMVNCNFGTGATANASGDASSNANVAALKIDCVNADPGYADAAGGNFSTGVGVTALGFPLDKIGGDAGTTRSYVDIGAQRQGGSTPAYGFVG